jgi:aryl-alcohol dehydrogenase-like predicted oxidoreductase
MRFKALGATGILVPAIGQGTMGIGGRFERDVSSDTECIRLLRLGVDLGLTLIDTAEVYGEGHTEELVGVALRGLRDRVMVATKFSPEHSTYEGVIRAAEGSLRRLKTDYIDLYQTHWPNPRVPIENTMRAMEKLVDDGKVRFIGLSNFSMSQTQRAQRCLHAPLVALQHEYNLFERTVEETLLPYCNANTITLFAYSPLAQGKIGMINAQGRRLSNIARKYESSVAQLVLAWLTKDPSVVAIPKASKESHIRENAEALGCEMDTTDCDEISKLFAVDIRHIPTNLIEVAAAADRKVYKTLEEAVENRFHLAPSPMELAEEIRTGEMLKPIKLRCSSNSERYQLLEGRVKYWAWVIAHDGKVPIPALVERTE